MSLGLNKPMLLEETFAKIYGFTAEDSILYHGNNLCEAMKQAIAMKENEYAGKLSALEKHAEKVYHKSAQTLRRTIEQITKD